MEATRRSQERCVYCGRYYRPDPRTRGTQKSCKAPECRAKRKKESHKKWLEANPDCFKGRYSEVKDWRKEHPDYQRLWRKKRREIQDEIPPAEPVRTMVLVIPEKILKSEIQDEIRLVRQCGCGFYVAGGKKAPRDTRLDCPHSPGCSTMTHAMGAELLHNRPPGSSRRISKPVKP
jgi:hypothetical protein